MTEDAAPLLLAVIAAIGYLLGSIPFGLLLTRAAGLGDIRKVGSGSIGATNVLRTGRKGLAAGTLLLDAAKGAASVLIGAAALGDLGAVTGGLAAVLGHLFPVWLRFRGGKGVATAFGVLIAASPLVALLAGAVWLATAFATRISSAASLAACVTAPVFAAAFSRSPLIVGMTLAAAILIVWRHAANIRRLLAGAEPRIGQKR